MKELEKKRQEEEDAKIETWEERAKRKEREERGGRHRTGVLVDIFRIHLLLDYSRIFYICILEFVWNLFRKY